MLVLVGCSGHHSNQHRLTRAVEAGVASQRPTIARGHNATLAVHDKHNDSSAGCFGVVKPDQLEWATPSHRCEWDAAYHPKYAGVERDVGADEKRQSDGVQNQDDRKGLGGILAYPQTQARVLDPIEVLVHRGTVYRLTPRSPFQRLRAFSRSRSQ